MLIRPKLFKSRANLSISALKAVTCITTDLFVLSRITGLNFLQIFFTFSIFFKFPKILNKAKVQKLTTKFFGTLASNGRLILINEVIDDFLSEVSRINGEVKAEVTSSFTLDQDQQKKVEAAISEATGIKKIILSTSVDESLIGGLIVKIGSKMIDNSLKTKLNRLEIAMRGTN